MGLQLTVLELQCVCCADDVVDAVKELPGVLDAMLDFPSSRLTVRTDGSAIGRDDVCAAVRRVGYRCEGDRSGRSTGQLAHAAQMAPITCGTKCDRMQYELPHTAAEEEHRDPAHEAAAHGHGGMSHDMSDPTMAAAMERDMRNRFFVALALTIPVVLLSRRWRSTPSGSSCSSPRPRATG